MSPAILFAGLQWLLVVDGQRSAAPTTSYARPAIDNVQLLDGALVASADGGDRVLLTGSNFGLGPLVQQVRDVAVTGNGAPTAARAGGVSPCALSSLQRI